MPVRSVSLSREKNFFVPVGTVLLVERHLSRATSDTSCQFVFENECFDAWTCTSCLPWPALCFCSLSREFKLWTHQTHAIHSLNHVYVLCCGFEDSVRCVGLLRFSWVHHSSGTYLGEFRISRRLVKNLENIEFPKWNSSHTAGLGCFPSESIWFRSQVELLTIVARL